MWFAVFGVAMGATFDWGTDCSSGTGDFESPVPRDAVRTIGTIPAGKDGVRVDLTANADVDVQVVDDATGDVIVGWPDGLLSGASEACASYKGLNYCYSGYNGVNGQLGVEWISVDGVTNRDVEMRAYGYEAGDAVVEYAWSAVNTCNERGDGVFRQYLPRSRVSEIGVIPQGKANLSIALASTRDIDVQLFAADGTPLVQWPDGLLNGPGAQTLQWGGMTIRYSGYNGVSGQLGHETLEVIGTASTPLTMKAFAYQAGSAEVSYEWGVGTGQACGSRGLQPCLGDLVCKNGDHGNTAVDIPGQCHLADWCESEASAAKDCGKPSDPAGMWTCEDFTCAQTSGGGGHGDACDSSADCAIDFVCMGELRYQQGIFCVGPDMYGTFGNATDGVIPSHGTIHSAVDVQGLASVPVDLVVNLDVDHPRKQDLRVTLTDPNGDVAIVWDREANPSSEVIVRNGIPGDDEVNGPWTLDVEDTASGATGTLRGWSLYVVSNYD